MSHLVSIIFHTFKNDGGDIPGTEKSQAPSSPSGTMSGIELAGLVLGAIPVVVAGLESYIKGVATIKRYFKYKNELKSLRTSLTTEYDIFRNSCEELLEGLVQTQRMALLLIDPGGALWKDPAIEKKLRRRLQDAYSGYLETVDDMELAIEEFKRRLKLKDGKVCHVHG